MSYYAKGQHGDGIHDFDAYDTTPYGGGYDISLTYGRSLPPSENICYHVTSSTSDNFDYNRPQYTSEAQPSAYAPQALANEYNSYSRPKTRPGYGSASGGAHYEKPQANYQFQPGMNHPTGGGGGGGEYEVSGYGNKSGSEYKKPGSEYERHGKSDHEKHGKKSDDKYKKSSYKKRDDDSDDSDDDHKDHHGRKKHGKNDSDDSDDEKKNRHKHQHQHHRKHYDD